MAAFLDMIAAFDKNPDLSDDMDGLLCPGNAEDGRIKVCNDGNASLRSWPC